MNPLFSFFFVFGVPYFDHDAFKTHHALHVLDAPAGMFHFLTHAVKLAQDVVAINDNKLIGKDKWHQSAIDLNPIDN